jgi:hypothetical protein
LQQGRDTIDLVKPRFFDHKWVTTILFGFQNWKAWDVQLKELIDEQTEHSKP